MTEYYRINNNYLLNMLGGKARFKLRSKKTGAEYQYYLEKAKVERSESIADTFTWTYFVRISNGEFYEFAGCIKYDTVLNTVKYMRTAEGLYGIKDTPVRALMWVIKYVSDKEKMKEIEIFHAGECTHCGLKMALKEDIDRGCHTGCIGECEKLVGKSFE